MKIRSGDTIIIIAGKNKNCVGTVEKVFKKTNKVVIASEDETFKKNVKHIKKNNNTPGRKEDFVAAIDVSNVALYHNEKPVKISLKYKDGKKIRVTRSGEEV